MYQRNPKGWLKHWDFMLIDLICLQLSLLLAYLLRSYGTHMFPNSFFYQEMMAPVVLIYVCVTLLTNPYSHIIHRGYYQEVLSVLKEAVYIFFAILLYLFASKKIASFSRLVFVYMSVFFCILSYLVRCIRKSRIRKHLQKSTGKRSMTLVSFFSGKEKFVQTILQNNYKGASITGIIIMNRRMRGQCIEGVPVVANPEEAACYLREHWVDEVFINAFWTANDNQMLTDLVNACKEMAITIHTQVTGLIDDGQVQEVGNICGYTVVTSSPVMATPKQLFLKRCMDILGGFVGCILTALLFLFVAPWIYIASPGPIFFTQNRIGKNGKVFKMYKFRSMYMDAEKRKKELMEQNNIKDGLMFKMENDPRIIKGIGHVVRDYSLDEFPQFWNVLKGDMSLVGTRPPTLDEWQLYETHHRARMSIKPGLTGLWQASGRSNIQDFEEVVRLDTQYIKSWSLGLDIKILFKTVLVVLKKEGSM